MLQGLNADSVVERPRRKVLVQSVQVDTLEPYSIPDHIVRLLALQARRPSLVDRGLGEVYADDGLEVRAHPRQLYDLAPLRAACHQHPTALRDVVNGDGHGEDVTAVPAIDSMALVPVLLAVDLRHAASWPATAGPYP